MKEILGNPAQANKCNCTTFTVTEKMVSINCIYGSSREYVSYIHVSIHLEFDAKYHEIKTNTSFAFCIYILVWKPASLIYDHVINTLNFSPPLMKVWKTFTTTLSDFWQMFPRSNENRYWYFCQRKPSLCANWV